jgi:phosphoribosylaminoimidazolecarboxamide formyltransferase/IMP cyclohydrolase
MIFGWAVEQGVTSNSVIFVKSGATVAIGTGEQDRVGVAEIAVFKAGAKHRDRLAWERYRTPFIEIRDPDTQAELTRETEQAKAGLKGSIMVSDAFFPFRDGVDVGIAQGISGVVHPGGSERDADSIQACNEANPQVTMMFTHQRAFKH